MGDIKKLLEKGIENLDGTTEAASAQTHLAYALSGIGYIFAALVNKILEIEDEQQEIEKQVDELNEKRSVR